MKWLVFSKKVIKYFKIKKENYKPVIKLANHFAN